MRILLDNGHGINTRGKNSPDKRLLEYKYCREITKRIKFELTELGYDVDIIVPEETDVPLAERVRRVNAICKKYGKENCILISVHNNAAGSDGKWHTASGWTGWIYTKASEQSKKLAQCLYKMAEKFYIQGNRSVPSCKYWTANYYIVKNTDCPAVLTENLFQDNKDEVSWLLSENGMTVITEVHVEGILEYLKQIGQLKK